MRATLACLLLSCAAALGDGPPDYINDAVQAGDGLIWARNNARLNELFTFDGKDWTVHPGLFAPEDRALPVDLVRMQDGSIECVWALKNHGVSVNRYDGMENRLLGRWTSDVRLGGAESPPLADSKNRLWISGDFPAIYRQGKDGWKLVHQIIAEDRSIPGDYPGSISRPVSAEDGHGRIWMASPSLRGLFIFTGDKLEIHPTLSAIPGAKIIALAQADAHHMWVAVADDGVYRVDIDSYAAYRENNTTKNALNAVEEFYVNGKDLYAVERVWPFPNCSLWQRRNGTWSCIVPKLSPEREIDHARSWLPVSGGVLLEDFGNEGPWYIPNEGPPARYSWRTGFDQPRAHALARLRDGSFFSIGDGKAFHGSLDFPPKDQANGRILDMKSDVPWVLDATKRIWFVPPDSLDTLGEWNGEKWVYHSIPVSTEHRHMPPHVRPDTEGRLWVQDYGAPGNSIYSIRILASGRASRMPRMPTCR